MPLVCAWLLLKSLGFMPECLELTTQLSREDQVSQEQTLASPY